MVNMETNSDERKIIDRVLHRDMVFRYQLLGRLQTDCEYYLNYGNRNIKRLWAGNVNLQIKLMVELYNSFKEDEKPQWNYCIRKSNVRGRVKFEYQRAKPVFCFSPSSSLPSLMAIPVLPHLSIT